MKPVAEYRRERGFSLVELSIVLVIIGLIIGAVSIGKDVHRNAVNQRIASEFVQGWLLAYDSYVAVRGVVPLDNVPPGIETGCINHSCASGSSLGTQLCDTALRNAMLEAGVGLPQGRAEGREDRYAYLDSNGLPHDLRVCFQNVAWSESCPTTAPGCSGGYVTRSRNTMRLDGLTPALANFLDHYFDTVVDARFGNFRQSDYRNATDDAKRPWSKNDTMDIADAERSLDEDQIAEVEAFMKMIK